MLKKLRLRLTKGRDIKFLEYILQETNAYHAKRKTEINGFTSLTDEEREDAIKYIRCNFCNVFNDDTTVEKLAKVLSERGVFRALADHCFGENSNIILSPRLYFTEDWGGTRYLWFQSLEKNYLCGNARVDPRIELLERAINIIK